MSHSLEMSAERIDFLFSFLKVAFDPIVAASLEIDKIGQLSCIDHVGRTARTTEGQGHSLA